MGQLERYGLYVLCLIIFLILGIAIWGDSSGPVVPTGGAGSSLTVTSATGPEDTISEERLRQLEMEANLNEVVKIMKAAAEPVRPPLQKVTRQPNDDVGTEPATQGSKGTATPAIHGKTQENSKQGERIHVVKQNETLEEISLRYLGKRHLWRDIVAANPGVRPEALQPGTKLRIPPRHGAKSTAGSRPGTVTVRRGDTPGLISQRLFGTTKYADEIMRLNGIQDARRLSIGAVLKVPDVGSSKATAKK